VVKFEFDCIDALIASCGIDSRFFRSVEQYYAVLCININSDKASYCQVAGYIYILYFGSELLLSIWMVSMYVSK